MELLFECDFETGDLGDFNTSGIPPIVTSDLSRSGKYAMKVQIGPGENRSEVSGPSSDVNKEYWYGFSIFLPKDFTVNENWEILAQWHGCPDFGIGEDWRSPVMALLTHNPNFSSSWAAWTLNLRWDSKRNTQESGETVYEGTETFELGAYETGVWTDWVFHVRWSYESDGFLEIWKNGVKILYYEGPNCFNDAYGPYFKMGIYASKVKDNRIVYHDEFRMADKNGTYTDVAPKEKQMTRFFDEKFEGVGYEEAGASETVGAGCTIDEDADSADAGNPSGWGSQCLKMITLAGVQNQVEWYNFGPKTISFFRFEIVIIAESLTNGGSNRIFEIKSDAWQTVFRGRIKQNASGHLVFGLVPKHDGSYNYYYGFPILSLNTLYRIEVKWDATNDHWAWEIDGVNQPNDQDTSSPVTTEGNLTLTHPTDCSNLLIGNANSQDADSTVYYDLIAIDDADWVGAEGWTGKIMGVTNPAKIMGVAVANISKVMGI